ncbi:MAG: hypothetical protein KGZ25_03645 [Planctomycetes bacterium]|nr:hypothetical protein [Planctomycetota bacterium]
MRRTRRFNLVDKVAVLFFVLVFAVVPLHAGEFEQFIPSDVTNYSVIHSYPTTVAKLKKSPYGSIIEEEEFKGMVDSISSKLDEQLSEFRKQVGVKLEDFADLPTGRIALAMKRQFAAGSIDAVANPFSRRKPQSFGDTWVLILIEVDGKEQAANQLLGRLLLRAKKEKQIQIETETFRDYKIQHIVITPAQGGKVSDEKLKDLDPELRKMMEESESDSAAQQSYDCYVNISNGIMAIATGSDRSLLERHLVLREGGNIPSLKQNELYEELKLRLTGKADYLTFQNMQPMWKMFEPADGRQNGFSVGKFVSELGITNIKGQISKTQIMEEGIYNESFLKVTSPHNGLLRAIDPEGKANVKPPVFVDRDAALFAGGYFDVPVFWQEIKAAIKRINPQMHGQIEQNLNNPQNPIHVEKDLINTLGTHWFVYVPAELISPNPPKFLNLMFVCDMKDVATLGGTIQKIMAFPQMQGKLSSIEFKGKEIYQAPQLGGGTVGNGVEMPSFQICFAFVNNRLIITTSPSLIKQAIRSSTRGQSPLLNNDKFQRGLSHMLERPSMVAYADTLPMAKWIWSFFDALPEHEIEFDLPEFKTVEKYLSAASITGRWEKDGMISKTWWPFPEGN